VIPRRFGRGSALLLLAAVFACEGGTSSPDVPAELVLSAESASFNAVERAQVNPQTIVVSSTAAGGLRWIAVSNVPWISLSPASGTTPTPVIVTVNTSGLVPGTQTGTVTVVADGATNSPRTIGITLNLTAAGQTGTYAIGVSANPAAGGSVTGAGNHQAGSNVTVNATPATGYTFTNWTEGGSVVSTSANYVFTASANRTLVANFAATSTSNYTITTSSNPSGGGTTTGGGTYTSGSSVTVTATPATGYTFTNWTEGGSVVSTSASYSFSANANRTLLANFGSGSGSGPFTIAVSSNPPAGGTTSPSGSTTVPAGSTLILEAFPARPAYEFENWTQDGAVVSTSRAFSLTVNANRSVVANFDRIPVVTVTAPEDLDVGQSITFAATCSDEEPAGCRRLTLQAESATNFATLATGTSSISGTANLSAFEGQQVTLRFTGEDFRVGRVSVTRTIYVESSTSLQRVATGGGRVLDYGGGRTLWVGTGGSVAPFAIRQASGSDEAIPLSGILDAAQAVGFLGPRGAILTSRNEGGLYDWRNGSLLTAVKGPFQLNVAGRYAVFRSGAGFFRRDLDTGAELTIATETSGSTSASVAANGDVVYDKATSVYRYRNGQTSQISPADSLQNVSPITDGLNVAYTRRVDLTGPRWGIQFYDGSVTTTLVPLSPPPSLRPPSDYTVRNGWAAFIRNNPDGSRQLWTRSPAGVLLSIVTTSSDLRIEELGDDGAVVGFLQGRRFLALPGGAPRIITGGSGSVVWRDGDFHLLLGRTVWKLLR
jgi:hypothetical protein